MLRNTFTRFIDKVIVKDFAHVRLITLNNPKALNALEPEMYEELRRLYITDPAPPSSLYILRGAGEKAFCSGGDVVRIALNDPPGCQQRSFYTEYQLDHYIGAGHVKAMALWNGYVMGGGVGLSLPGAYRIATEKACFAMPETAIGLIPDVGASWFLPRLPQPSLGLLLGLTGHRLRGADTVHAGLATHYVLSDRLPQLEAALCAMKDPAHEVGVVLEAFAESQLPPFSLEAEMPFVESVFTVSEANTVPRILRCVREEAERSGLAKAVQERVRGFSPTVMCVTLEMLRRGAKLTRPSEAYQMEYCISQRLCAEHDFAEGVRALLVDKDKSPKWQPASVEEVTTEAVAKYFEPTYEGQVTWQPLVPDREV